MPPTKILRRAIRAVLAKHTRVARLASAFRGTTFGYACALTLIVSPATSQVSVLADDVFAEHSAPGGPGCSVGASVKGSIVLSSAYGAANLEHDVPIAANTVFEAGSVAKQFAAAAILMLVEEGKLSLQDDVRTYVPELPEYGRTITIDHLLTHTSGLREWGEVADLGGLRPLENVDVLEILGRQRSLNFQPGTQFGYVGTGFTLVSVIVERVTGTPLAQFSRERIFEPLGMTSTQWRDDYRRVVDNRAVAYRRSGSSYLKAMPPERNIYGHGGLLTTTPDLLRWNEALAGNELGVFVTEELETESYVADLRPTGYGRGVFLGEYNGRKEIHHDGGYGAYRAWLARYPEFDVSIALLCNTAVPNIIALGREVAELVLPPRMAIASSGSPDSPPYDESVRVPARASDEYMGVFISDKSGLPIVLSADGDRLTADDYPLEEVGPGHFRVSWGDLVFENPDLIRLIRRNGEVILLRRVPGSPHDGAELTAVEGLYHSDEAIASYTAAIEQGRLVMRLVGRPSHAYVLDPIARDVFAMPSIVVRFTRNAASKVTSFTITVPRVRSLIFDAVAK